MWIQSKIRRFQKHKNSQLVKTLQIRSQLSVIAHILCYLLSSRIFHTHANPDLGPGKGAGAINRSTTTEIEPIAGLRTLPDIVHMTTSTMVDSASIRLIALGVSGGDNRRVLHSYNQI